MSQTANKTVVWDLEIYPNYLLFCFFETSSNTYKTFEYYESRAAQDTSDLEKYIADINTAIGFNQLYYDNLMLQEFIKTRSVAKCKKFSDKTIEGKARKYEPTTHFPVEIDLLQIMDRKGGLKIFQARMGLNEIVIDDDFNKTITKKNVDQVLKYCKHDVYATYELYKQKEVQAKIEVKKNIAKQFDLSIFSLTESDIAEQIFRKAFNYRVKNPETFINVGGLISPKVKFSEKQNQQLLEEYKRYKFKLKLAKDGSLRQTKRFEKVIELGNIKYNIGVGGLHSHKTVKGAYVAKDDEILWHIDVSSYYPNTVKNLGLYPERRKEKFRKLYCGMIEDRNKAKAEKDKPKDKALKIVLNASYGRFKYKNSCLYDAKMLYNITVNCQLFFVLLIEQFYRAKIDVLYVNTDGLVIRTKKERESDVNKVIEWWQNKLGYKLDKDELQAAFIKDTNNRLFLGKNGKIVQSKGAAFIAEYTLFHNKKSSVAAAKAVHNYFLHNKPVKQTMAELYKESNWQDFVVFQNRKGSQTKEVDENIFDFGEEIHPEKEQKKKLYRYYVSDDPRKAKRVKGVCSRPIITAYNIERDFDINLVDLSYYENEAQKIIDKIAPPEPPKDDEDLFSSVDDPKTPSTPLSHKNHSDTPKSEKSPSGGFLWLKKAAVGKDHFQKVMDLLLDQRKLYMAHRGKSTTLRYVKNYRQYINYRGKIADDFSYICLNPFQPGTTEKSKKYILSRNCVTIEYDNKELLEQWQLMKHIPHTVVVYSGGKSLHCHIRFTRPLAKGESEKLNQYLLALFGESDHATWKENQYVRMPFGKNYDTGRDQLVISVQNRVDPNVLFSWLESERKKQGVELIQNKIQSLSSNTPNKPYVTYCVYSLRQQLPDFKIEKSHDQVTLVGKCPQGHLHSKGVNNDDSFYINIKFNGQIYKYCHHNSCGGGVHSSDETTNPNNIRNKQFKELGIRLKSRDMVQKFYNTTEFKNLGLTKFEFKKYLSHAPKESKDNPETTVRNYIENIKPIEIDEKYKVSEILEKLTAIREKEGYILTLPTGTGKTYSMLLACKHLVEKRGENIVFVCGTKNEVFRAVRILKGLGVSTNDVEIFISYRGSTGEDSSTQKNNKQKQKAPYTITTYGYWGRKAQTQQIYTGFNKRIENAYVFFDECQTMVHNSEISENLTALYRKGKGEYYKTNSFNLEDSYIIANKKRGEITSKNTRHFHGDFLEKNADDYKIDNDYHAFTADEVLKHKDFIRAASTVFVKPCGDIGAEKPQIIDIEDKSEDTYIKSLCNDLLYLHLRAELPIYKKSGKALSYDEIEKLKKEHLQKNVDISILKDQIQFPKQTPFSTAICGYDRLGFWQLTGMTIKIKEKSANEGSILKSYRKPKGLVFSSATISPVFKEITKETLGDTFTIKTIGSDTPPCTFDVTTLKTSEKISLANQCKLIEEIITKRNEKTFVVCATQSHATDLYMKLSHFETIAFFEGTDYIQVRTPERDKPIQVVITYPNSAICKGENLPDFQIAVIDSSMYIPNCALTVRKDKTQEDIKAALYQTIQQKLTQTCGRLLRTEKEIIKDHTIQDQRKICILLHSLPPEIEQFTLDEKLIHSKKEHLNDGWLASIKSKSIVKSAFANIENVVAGKSVEDYASIERKKIVSKKPNQQSKEERAATADAKQAKKQEEILKKVTELLNEAEIQKKQGVTWREFEKNKSLHQKQWLKSTDFLK